MVRGMLGMVRDGHLGGWGYELQRRPTRSFRAERYPPASHRGLLLSLALACH